MLKYIYFSTFFYLSSFWIRFRSSHVVCLVFASWAPLWVSTSINLDMTFFFSVMLSSCNKLSTALKKVTVDALFYSPVAISWFLFCMGMLDGLSMAQARRKIQTRLTSALVSAWAYWPTVNLLLFKFVPHM